MLISNYNTIDQINLISCYIKRENVIMIMILHLLRYRSKIDYHIPSSRSSNYQMLKGKITLQNVIQSWSTSLPQIENLVLNGTYTSWQDVIDLSRKIPSLTELHACENGILHGCCHSVAVTEGLLTCKKLLYAMLFLNKD